MSPHSRTKSEVVLIRAAQVWPFVDTIARRGGDVTALAEKAGMPLEAVHKKQGLIGERSAWRFAGYAAKALGIEHLGHIVALEHPVQSTGELGGMRLRMATTLGRLLKFFVEDVTYENNGAKYALVPDGPQVVFRREVIFPDCIGRWQTEQYMVTVLLQIIDLCGGPVARPSKIRLASSGSPRPIPVAWSDQRIEWASTATEIVLDEQLLELPITSGIEALEEHHARVHGTPVSAADIDFLVDRQIWSGGANLESVARELGFSSSTLKRRLHENGRSFSDIVGTRRHYWAERLLSETGTPIADVASTLGYGHLPNFSRAFKARSGVTPRAFRAGQRN